MSFHQTLKILVESPKNQSQLQKKEVVFMISQFLLNLLKKKSQNRSQLKKLQSTTNLQFKSKSNKHRNNNRLSKQPLRRKKVLPLTLQQSLPQLNQPNQLRKSINWMFNKKHKIFQYLQPQQQLLLMIRKKMEWAKRKKLWQWLKLKWQAWAQKN